MTSHDEPDERRQAPDATVESVVLTASPDLFLRARTPAFRRVTTALVAAGFSTYAVLYCVQPLLPVFSADLHISPSVLEPFAVGDDRHAGHRHAGRGPRFGRAGPQDHHGRLAPDGRLPDRPLGLRVHLAAPSSSSAARRGLRWRASRRSPWPTLPKRCIRATSAAPWGSTSPATPTAAWRGAC